MTQLGQSKHGTDEKIAEQNKPNIIKIGGANLYRIVTFQQDGKT